MRYACLLCVALVSLLSQPAPCCQAQDASADELTLINKYIDDLGSPEFTVRQRAHVELEKIGLPAREALQKATRSNDAEVRRAAGELLQNLGTVLLPAPLEDVAVAASGRILVLKLREQKGLTIYDTRIRKLKTIELPTSDFTLGAGGNVAVVFLKKSVELRAYNLTTLELIRSKEFVDPVVIQRIVMGHSRDDLAYVRLARILEDRNDSTSNLLLDVTTMKLQRPVNREHSNGHNTSYSDVVHYRANGDINRLTEWSSSDSPRGIYLLTRFGQGYQVQGNSESTGHLALGDDGKIYTGYGQVMDLSEGNTRRGESITALTEIAGQSLFPGIGIGGRFFLGLKSDGSIFVYQSGVTAPLSPLEAFPQWALPMNQREDKVPDLNLPPGRLEKHGDGLVTLDRRIVFAPAAGHIIFLPHSNDRLIHRKFDLKAVLDATEKHYLLAVTTPALRTKSGSKWSYQIETLEKHGPVEFKLEKAPEGMSLSPKGQLTWKIPSGIQGTAEVTVVITDSKSYSISHSFTIAFE
jgi:hypothetical protein